LAKLDGPILAISGLSASYGRVPAVIGLDLEVAPGECVAVLGANGAGKTTLFRALSGIMVSRNGKVLFCGKDIVRAPPHEIVSLGIGHVAEGKHLFAPLSVTENLEMGALPLLRSGRGQEVHEARRLVFELFPRLRERGGQLAGTLSGGEQQMLVIGRAIMSRPKLLLLDEPSAGLAPLVIEQMFSALAKLKALGLTIMLAEQNVALGLRYADRGIVLRLGRLALCAAADRLRTSSEIQHLYLGGEQNA
jgi:branched-chain amino acid transport system ATP-binding protein